MKNDYRA